VAAKPGRFAQGVLQRLADAARQDAGVVVHHLQELRLQRQDDLRERRLRRIEGLDGIFIEAGFDWRGAGCSMCLAMNPDKLQGRAITEALAGGNPEATAEVARKFKIPHWTGDLAESLKQPGVEAVILATPTKMHARQAIQCMRAGKHVQVEIPMSESLADAREIARVQKETGLVAMAGQTRRFTPSHQWVRRKILAGELKLQHLVVQTFFFRRTNMNAAGKPRSLLDRRGSCIPVTILDVVADGGVEQHHPGAGFLQLAGHERDHHGGHAVARH